MGAAAPGAEGIRIGDVLNEVFEIYGRNIVALLASAIVVFVIVGLVAGLLLSTGGIVLGIVAGIVRLAGHALYTGFVVRVVERSRQGDANQPVGDLFASAAPAILPLIVFGILFAIGVGIGLVLIIVPGLILLTFWSVGAPAIVVERAGPLHAFSRSWSLVRGNAWAVFGTILVVFLIVIVVGFVLGAIATPIGDGAIIVASILASVLTAPVFSLASAVLYFQLSGR